MIPGLFGIAKSKLVTNLVLTRFFVFRDFSHFLYNVFAIPYSERYHLLSTVLLFLRLERRSSAAHPQGAAA